MISYKIPWWLTQEIESDHSDPASDPMLDFGRLDPEIVEWCVANLRDQPRATITYGSVWNSTFTSLQSVYNGSVEFDNYEDAMHFKLRWL